MALVTFDTERSDLVTGEEQGETGEEVVQGNGKQHRTRLAERLNVSRSNGIIRQNI